MSRTESGSGVATETPRLGSRVARPSATRTPSASRTVGRETPSDSASATSRSGGAGLQLAVEDGPAQLVGDPVDGRGELEVEGAERRRRSGFGHGGHCALHSAMSDCLTIMQSESNRRRDPWTQLAWGRRYVMVEPTHFRVEYVINPFMDPADQPDPELAMAQWRELVATIERLGGTVDVLPQRADAPDMVYAMNLGLGLVREDGTAARRDVAHALRRAPDGDRLRAALVRRARLHHVVRRPRRRRRPPRGRRRVRVRRRAGRRLRPAHRGARAQAPGHRPRRPGPRAADHAPGDVPPRPGLLPARRAPRAGLPGRARRGLGRRAARAGARAAGAHRGGGADDVLRQLDRASARPS